jgi:drug/metabolite transporter (DMT)-like permease
MVGGRSAARGRRQPGARGARVAENRHWQTLRVDLLLMLVALIWGSTFIVVQDSVRLTGPFTFLTLRFGIAALALAIMFRRRLVRLTRGEITSGAVIGVFLFAGYALQTLSLQLTTSSKVGFLTGLYVVMVPPLALVVLGQRPGRRAVIGVVLATLGLALLSLRDNLDLAFGWGEALALGGAAGFAAHIVAISKFAPRADPINLALVQIAVTAGLSAGVAPLVGEPLVGPPAAVWGAALFLGLVATAFALVVMNRVQQFTSSTRATLIYALEPVFAGIFGYLAGETLSLPAWIGCGLILAGMVSAEVHPRAAWRRYRERRNPRPAA